MFRRVAKHDFLESMLDEGRYWREVLNCSVTALSDQYTKDKNHSDLLKLFFTGYAISIPFLQTAGPLFPTYILTFFCGFGGALSSSG